MGYKIGTVLLLSRRLGVAVYFSYSMNLPDF
jgi:hypothetical protein